MPLLETTTPDQRLLHVIRELMPDLTALLSEMESAVGSGMYRYYHQSIKIFDYQEYALRALRIIRQIAETTEQPINPFLIDIMQAGTARTFNTSTNARWSQETRPVLEAFLHAHYLIGIMVKHGAFELAPASRLPYDWTALLALFEQH